MLFTADTGEQHGYKSGWTDDGVFLYTGGGQVGNMEVVRGNRAIRDHTQDGKTLQLFKSVGKAKGYHYVGSFFCASWENQTGSDMEGNIFQAIMFHLVLAHLSSEYETDEIKEDRNIDELRERAYKAATPSSRATRPDARRVTYERSAEVRTYVLRRTGGACKLCQNKSPFKTRKGTWYLESHHTCRVADGEPDHLRWVGAVCPNCHREIHYGVNGRQKNDELIHTLGRLEEHHP